MRRLTRGRLAPALATLPFALLLWLAPRGVDGQLLGETVLSADDLAEGRGQTLIDFLSARVPGLFVHFVHNVPSASPRIGSWASSGTAAAPEPLLYVDGILVTEDQHRSTGLEFRPTSLAWSLPVDEVAEVRVLLGPTATTRAEFSSSRGIIHVTTKPAARERTVQASAQLVGGGYVPPGQPTYGRLGVQPSGTVMTNCTRWHEVLGVCTPGESLQWNPLREQRPYIPAGGYSAAVSATGASGLMSYRVGATGEALQGVLPETGRRRTELSLSTSNYFRRPIRIRFDARYSRLEGPQGAFDTSPPDYLAARTSPVASDSVRRAFDEGIGQQRRNSYETLTDQLLVGTSARYESERWTWHARAGQQWLWRNGSRLRFFSPTIGDFLGEARGDSPATSAAVDGSRRLRLPGAVALELSAGAAWVDTEATEELTEQRVQGGSLAVERWQTEGSATSIWGGLEARVGERLAVRAALRSEDARGARPQDPMLSASADAVLRDAEGRRGPSIRLATAYAEAGDIRVHGDFPSASPPLWARSREWRSAVHAQWGEGIALELSHARHGVSSGPLVVRLGFTEVVPDAEWTTAVTGLALRLRGAADAGPRWQAQTTVLARGTRVERLSTPASLWKLGSPTIAASAGGSLGDYRAGRYGYDDANGDGILIPAEMVYLQEIEGLGETDPRVIVTAGGRAAWTRLAVGAQLEAQLGHVVFDRVGATQCNLERCRASFDPSASLDEQAAALAYRWADRAQGFVHPADFLRLRRAYVELPTPLGRIQIAANQIPLSSRPVGLDPEATPLIGGLRSGVVGASQPLTATYSIHLDISW